MSKYPPGEMLAMLLRSGWNLISPSAFSSSVQAEFDHNAVQVRRPLESLRLVFWRVPPPDSHPAGHGPSPSPRLSLCTEPGGAGAAGVPGTAGTAGTAGTPGTADVLAWPATAAAAGAAAGADAMAGAAETAGSASDSIRGPSSSRADSSSPTPPSTPLGTPPCTPPGTPPGTPPSIPPLGALVSEAVGGASFDCALSAAIGTSRASAP